MPHRLALSPTLSARRGSQSKDAGANKVLAVLGRMSPEDVTEQIDVDAYRSKEMQLGLE